ncbi:uncharacterized protein LOC144861197 [Branchiostoma floridae x Branchiostoma japonicum]
MATVMVYFAVASSAGYQELKSWQLSAGQQLQELETQHFQGLSEMRNLTHGLMEQLAKLNSEVLHGFAELHACKREVEERLAYVEYSGFRTANFTTLGATGRAGPTSLGDHYRGQDHEKLVTLQNGIQLFTVPETGNYSIEAAGASGGWDVYSFKMTSGRVESVVGRGARVAGTFFLQKAALLKILAGQEGGKNNDTFSSGGGGGTFVTSADDTPLLIAGGGGGIQHLARNRHAECHGTAATEGQDAPWLVRLWLDGFAGGRNGHGATVSKGYVYVGGGGGGLLTNGGSGKLYGGTDGSNGGEGGYAFVNGGKGGRGKHGSDGGFGGGGGGFGGGAGPGGGGGYSGGGRGKDGIDNCGGGGGSYNNGTNPMELAGANVGPGYVVITKVR